MFAAITANSVQKRMGSLITSLCASSSFTQAGYVRGMVNFELSPLVPPKDRRHCALAPRNDGPINPVVSTSPIVRRRLRSLPIAEFANRRVEHGPFPHTEFGFPENQARGRCHGVEAVLSALVHPGRLDHGWGALAPLAAETLPGCHDYCLLGPLVVSVCSCSIAAFRWSLVSSF
jgi:hypothetical protein